MSDVMPVAQDHYDAVLSDLRAKRDEIDRVIQTLESFRSGLPVSAATPKPQPAFYGQPAEDGPGAFLGMTIVEAAQTHLKRQRRPMGNAELYSAFKAGGMVLTSADPINVISSVLTRRFNSTGDIVRVSRGTWGLSEWYPNRNFKKKVTAKDETGDEAVESPAEVQTSLQPKSPLFG